MEVAEELKPTVFESAQKLDEFAETNDEPVEEVCETTKSTIEVPTEPSTELDRSEILSRRKQKKLLKLAKYEEIKKQKRLRERQKQKEKRAIEAAKGIPGPNKLRKALKHNKMEKSKNTVRVAIDFDYDELMIDKDIAKCAKQLLRVYTLNRKSTMPIRLHYTSLRPNSKIENSLKRNDGYHNWDVKMTSESFLKVFDRDSIVYLTSDSDNVLEEIDPNAAYIIGGLVDHNHHKGLSLQKAEENGLKTARLPLAEYISMKTRTVLTIVHVFEILLRVSEGKPWKETLLEVLPQRKFKPPGSRKNRAKQADDGEMDQDSASDDAKIEAAKPQTDIKNDKSSEEIN